MNAAATQLGTTWPSLRKAFTRHGLGMPARNPEAVRQRAVAAARPRSGQPAQRPASHPTPGPGVCRALNPHALPARPRSSAELHQWVRRDEEYATLAPTWSRGAEQRKPRPPAHHPRLGDHPPRRTLNANGSFTYTPAANYNGSDSFSYRASDGTVESSPATVAITVSAVNDAPTAGTDAYSTGEDTTLTVNAPGVLTNDSDPDGNQLSAVLGSGPSHGSLALNANGSFTYTPAVNFNGSDSFTYRASDGTATSGLAAVTLTVSAVNDAPAVTVAAGGTCGRDDYSGTVNLVVADVES